MHIIAAHVHDPRQWFSPHRRCDRRQISPTIFKKSDTKMAASVLCLDLSPTMFQVNEGNFVLGLSFGFCACPFIRERERERERENSSWNSKILFYKDCSPSPVKTPSNN